MANSDAAIVCPACKAENKVGARFCRQCGAQIAAAAAGYDRAKWQALVQYDPDISAAADTVRPFGQMWVDELGASYMALNDKSYLTGIVEKVTARAKAEKQRQAEIKQQQAEIQAAATERARQDELERQRIAEQRRERLEKIRVFLLRTNTGRAALAAAVGVIAAVAVLSYYLMLPAVIDERIVWKPSDITALSALNCASGNANEDCLSNFMERNGATSQAVAFAREIRGRLSRPSFERDAYAEQVTHLGPVSMVKVVFPFENQGIGNEDFLLLSPSRTITDPNDSRFTGSDSSLAPSKQAAFSQLLTSFPNALVWPVPDFDHEENSNQGGPRLVFKYPILNGCHACDLVGWAKFAFDFDSGGHFMGASIYQVMTQQPSFDCTKVHRWAELQVCATPMLAVKDAQMGGLYASAITRTSPKDRLSLRAAQRAWIKLRDQCQFNGGITCLIQEYAARIAFLSGAGPLVQSPAQTVAPNASSTNANSYTVDIYRDQGIDIATGSLNDGREDFSLMGYHDTQTGGEERDLNFRPGTGGPDAVDSARIAFYGTAGEPGLQGCSAASLGGDDILAISNMVPGTWFCIRGTDGHLAEMRLNSVIGGAHGINVTVVKLQ
jgi:uncharacterized protein